MCRMTPPSLFVIVFCAKNPSYSYLVDKSVGTTRKATGVDMCIVSVSGWSCIFAGSSEQGWTKKTSRDIMVGGTLQVCFWKIPGLRAPPATFFTR